MGFFGSLFGDRIANENTTKPIFKCTTREERKDWFARTRPWHKTPPSLVDAIVRQLEDQPPVMLELFTVTAPKVRLLPAFERLQPDVQGTVACAVVAGMFAKAGSPLVQQFVMRKQALAERGAPSEREMKELIELAGVAKDCLELATVIHKPMIAAYGPLAFLLAETGEMETALEFAQRGLAAIKEVRAHAADFRKSSIESIRQAPEDLAMWEQKMQQMVDALAEGLRQA